jgi:hypothetical protein
MTALVLASSHATLARPSDPHKPNGIAHATTSTTKADRIVAKNAWVAYVNSYKKNPSTTFPNNGEIKYSGE